MKRTVITIVGGGAFAPRLCEVLGQTIDLPEVELRLAARRQRRLDVLVHHSARRVGLCRPGWSVQAASSLEAAFEDSSIVVLLVRVGGLEARAWDERFPQRFGLAGDEGLGPGGIANAWRTLPELANIAQELKRVAPAARVLNLMAPLGITTRLLLERGLDAIGVCELPLATLQSWLAQVSPSACAVSWRYAGLNHLGWFWDVLSGDTDVLQLISDRPSDQGALIDGPTLAHYRAAPLRYFYDVFEPEAGRRLKLKRPRNRATELIALSETLVRRYAENPGLETDEAKARLTPWLDQAVAPIASAFLGGPAYKGFTNVRNDSRIPELPSELVVEVPATVSAEGVSPVSPGPLPHRVGNFLAQVGHSELLSFQASEQQDAGLLAEAIRALPLAIPEAAVEELTMLAQHRP